MEGTGNQPGNQPRNEQTSSGSDMPGMNVLDRKSALHSNAGFKAVQISEYIFWILSAVVLLRFAFKLIGANPKNQFVVLIYQSTDAIVNIFKGIVGDITSGTITIELSSLITVLILYLVFKAVAKLITIVR
jgi:hypothetical protein